MAFPTIPTAGANTLLATPTTTASTTHTFPNLTTLAPAAGDLLIAICVQYSGTSGGSPNVQFSGWGASFTETRDDATTTANDLAVGVAHKIATGSESGTFTVTSAFAARSVNFLMRIPAATWHGTTIPEVAAAVRATGAVADPGSLDPTNWGTEDTLWIAVYGHSETTTTGTPPVITASPTNYSGDLIVARNADAVGHITAGVGFRQVNAASENAGTWTVTDALRGNGAALTIAVRPAALTTITHAMGNALEGNLLNPITRAKKTSLGLIEETERLWSVVPDDGPVQETNTPQAMKVVKVRSLGLITSSEAPQPITADLGDLPPIVHNLGLIESAETGQAISRSKLRALGLAAEGNAAQDMAQQKVRALGLALSGEAAQDITQQKIRTLGLAAEGNAAGALARTKLRALGLAAEGNAAQAFSVVGPPIIHALGLAREFDTPQSETMEGVRAIGLAAEGNALWPLTITHGAPIIHALGLAAEGDTVQALTRRKIVRIAVPIDGTSEPLPGNPIHPGESYALAPITAVFPGAGIVLLGLVTESEAAQALTARKLRALGLAASGEAVQGITERKIRPLGLALEGNAAEAITRAKLRSLGLALEGAAAQPMALAKLRSLGLVTESNASWPLILTGYVQLGLITESEAVLAMNALAGFPAPPIDLPTNAVVLPYSAAAAVAANIKEAMIAPFTHSAAVDPYSAGAAVAPNTLDAAVDEYNANAVVD